MLSSSMSDAKAITIPFICLLESCCVCSVNLCAVKRGELSLEDSVSSSTPKMTITIKTASFFHSAHYHRNSTQNTTTHRVYQQQNQQHQCLWMCPLENLTSSCPSPALLNQNCQWWPIIKPSHFISFRDSTTTSTEEDDNHWRRWTRSSWSSPKRKAFSAIERSHRYTLSFLWLKRLRSSFFLGNVFLCLAHTALACLVSSSALSSACQ